MAIDIYSPDYYRIADFLGLDPHQKKDPHTFEKISVLYEWASREAKSDDVVAISVKLQDVTRKLGTNVRGKTLVNDLYSFLRLKLDRETKASEMKQMETKERERLNEINKKRREAQRAIRNREKAKVDYEKQIKKDQQKIDRKAKKDVQKFQEETKDLHHNKDKVIDVPSREGETEVY